MKSFSALSDDASDVSWSYYR